MLRGGKNSVRGDFGFLKTQWRDIRTRKASYVKGSSS